MEMDPGRILTYKPGNPTVNVITFVVAKKNSPDGRHPFTILRVSDTRQDVVSFHTTVDEATEAAVRYASLARYSGLESRVHREEWLIQGTT
jgi:hypothetical protein